MTFHRHDSRQKIQEVRCEERVSAEIREPDRLSLDDGDFFEAHIEELLQQHWLRQRSGQSPREGRRAFEHVLRQPFVEHEVRDGDAASGLENAQRLGENPALAR